MRDLLCPRCGYPQYCGCQSCRDSGRTPPGAKPYRWITPNGPTACGSCGFAQDPNWWMDEEVFQLEKFSQFWSRGEFSGWFREHFYDEGNPRRVWRPSRAI